MTFDADDVTHCDSLSGATIGSPALSVPPSLRPPRRRARLRFALSVAGGAGVLAGALVAFAHRSSSDASAPEALHVEGQTVSYSAGFAERAGIRTMEIREAAFAPIISVTGKTAFDPERVASVGASALGTVRRVAKYEGEAVKRGEVLAEIGSPLQARMEAAASLRARELPRGQLGVALLRSPLDGMIVERRVVTGQSVRGERVAFVVADLDRLSLDVSVEEEQAHALKVGDRVELQRDAGSGSSASALAYGRVSAVLGVLGSSGPGSRVSIRVGVDNRARALRPGQAVTARIFAGQARAIVIPNRALAWIAGHPSVFVERGHNSASASAVTLGDCDGEQTEVRVGLASGQRIVSDGVSNLKEASFL
ncbi:MAG: efflux RND transporter periplasmic adaptor subunit [Myxococcales bacterium]